MASMKKSIRKTKIHEIAIWIGWGLFGLGRILERLLFENFDPLSVSQREATTEWAIRQASGIGLALALSLMLVFGIREIQKECFSIKKLLNLLIAVVFLISLSAFGFYTNSILTKFNESIHPHDFFNEIEADINNTSIPLEKRTGISKFYAKMRYEEDGIITEYLSPEGNKILYEPTAEAKASRAEWQRNKELMAWSQKTTKRAGIQWLAILALSILFGFFPKVKKPSNKIMSLDKSSDLSQ